MVSILRVLGYSSLLRLMIELSYLPRGFVDSTFRGEFFWHWPLLIHSCLSLSSSYNSPPKPHFLFANRGESSSTFLMRSHVGTSFQLSETRSWRFGIHDVVVNAADSSPFPTFYGKIMILQSSSFKLKERKIVTPFFTSIKRGDGVTFLNFYSMRKSASLQIIRSRSPFFFRSPCKCLKILLFIRICRHSILPQWFNHGNDLNDHSCTLKILITLHASICSCITYINLFLHYMH